MLEHNLTRPFVMALHIKASQDHPGGPVKFVSLAPLPQPRKPVYPAAQEGAKSFLACGKALVVKRPLPQYDGA